VLHALKVGLTLETPKKAFFRKNVKNSPVCTNAFSDLNKIISGSGMFFFSTPQGTN
jgi:hypothetical protein